MTLPSESGWLVSLFGSYKPWYLMWRRHSYMILLAPGEQVYMNCPPGMVHQTDECLLLLKTLCSLIQAARHYFNFFSKILIEIGFQQSPADPCLFLFKNAMGLMLVIVYVDDVGLDMQWLNFFLMNWRKEKLITLLKMTSQIIWAVKFFLINPEQRHGLASLIWSRNWGPYLLIRYPTLKAMQHLAVGMRDLEVGVSSSVISLKWELLSLVICVHFLCFCFPMFGGSDVGFEWSVAQMTDWIS